MISTTFDNFFCILSNLLCILPTYLFYKDKNYHDSLFVGITGITSFVYHLNNNKPDVVSYLDQNSISNADYFISDLCVLNIGSYLAFYKLFNIRTNLLIVEIPLEMYSISYGNMYRTYFMYTTSCVLFFKFIYTSIKLKRLKKSNLFILILAVLINIVEIACFEWLQKINDEENYNFYHAIHHVCAFLSITLYFFVPKKFVYVENRRLPRITSHEFLNEQNIIMIEEKSKEEKSKEENNEEQEKNNIVIT